MSLVGTMVDYVHVICFDDDEGLKFFMESYVVDSNGSTSCAYTTYLNRAKMFFDVGSASNFAKRFENTPNTKVSVLSIRAVVSSEMVISDNRD